jgi:hypothetical protein
MRPQRTQERPPVRRLDSVGVSVGLCRIRRRLRTGGTVEGIAK